MIFKTRFIMAVFALFLMACIFIVLSNQTKLQSEILDATLPALSPPSTRTKLSFPKWMGDFKPDGQILFISFWASWCEPCIDELPFFESLQDQFQKMGVRTLLVNLDYGEGPIAAAKKMKQELAPNLESVYENASSTDSQLKLKGLPYHVLIDRSGRVAMSFYAPLAKYKSVFRRRVKELWAETASP